MAVCTPNCLEMMMRQTWPTSTKPIVEIRGAQPLSDGQRWKLSIADGRHVVTAVAVKETAGRLQDQGEPIGLLLRLDKYGMQRSEKQKLILFLLEFTVVGRTRPDNMVGDQCLTKLTPEQDLGGDVLPATQVIVEDHSRNTGGGLSAGAYLTPERRVTPVPETTPNPPMAPSSRSAQPFGRSVAEELTQPGFVDPPGMPQAAPNPYSTPQFGASFPSNGGMPGGGNPYETPTERTRAAPEAPAAARFGTTAPVAGVGSVTPVSALNAYTGGRWKIKARVLTKGDIRKFNNQRGEGQLFKVDLGDKTGEISATFFGKAVDKYYNMLKPEKVYTFQKGQIKPANKRYDRGDHVLIFEEHSLIEPTGEDDDIPKISYDFRNLCEVDGLPPETHIDTKSVIYAVQDPFTFTAKTSQKEMTKRVIHLWDPSGDPSTGATSELTLWGDAARSGEFEVGQAIFLKKARVSEFNGQKTLASPAGMQMNPDDPRAFALLRSFQQLQQANPHALQVRSNFGLSSSKRQTIEGMRQEDINLGPPPVPGQQLSPNEPKSIHRHWVAATLTVLPTDRGPYYTSCPQQIESTQAANSSQPNQRTCNKKVALEADGLWHCAAGHACQQPDFRYLCRMNVLDHTDKVEVNLYDEQVLRLLQCPAKDYVQIFDEGTNSGEREAELRQINGRMEWKRCLLRLRAQKEVWQENERIRYSVEEVQPVNFTQDARQMLADIRECLAAAPP